MLISPDYLEINKQMHGGGQYGVCGHRWAPAVDELAAQLKPRTILDYGCGSGTLKTALDKLGRGYQVLEYDPAIPGKDEKPIRADMVVCGDVLEHVEPDCLNNVLADIRNTARVGVFLVVATVPAIKRLPDGRNTHLIVKPAYWWLPKLMMRWRARAFNDIGQAFFFVGTTI